MFFGADQRVCSKIRETICSPDGSSGLPPDPGGRGRGVPPGYPNLVALQRFSRTLSDMPTTAVRFTLTTLSTLTVALGVYVVPTTHPHAGAQPLSTCEYEDGNTDGMPCNWVDPDTGTVYRVSSENYR